MFALVTGAGSAIGRATAIALARNGYAVALLGYYIEDVAPLEADLRSQGYQALAIKTDIFLEDELTAAVDQLAEFFGRLVVANAGINGVWAPIDDLKPDKWDRTIAVNLRGTYLTIYTTPPPPHGRERWIDRRGILD